MANFILEDTKIPPIRIKIVGVGGGGGKIVGRISKLFEGIDTIAIDTDVQALRQCPVAMKVQIGEKITGGRGGAGCDPEKGKFAANEDRGKISEVLKNTDIIFLIAGLGGGTGSGAAPVAAKIARDQGSLVIGIVTMPFKWEKKDAQAEIGFSNLKISVDTLIAFPNERLKEIVEPRTPLKEAIFRMDEVISRSIYAVSDLINKRSYLKDLDFTDIKRVLENGGRGIVGTGSAKGDKKALKAIKAALSDPLLGENELQQAKNILVSIIGSNDVSMEDVDEAMTTVQEVATINEVATGLSFDDKLEDEVKVTLIATGIEGTREQKKKAGIRRAESQEDEIFGPISEVAPGLRGSAAKDETVVSTEMFPSEFDGGEFETPPSQRKNREKGKKDNETRNL